MTDTAIHNITTEKLWKIITSDTIVRLLPIIVHDLNNNMTAIRGYSELIKRNTSKKHCPEKDVEAIIIHSKKGAVILDSVTRILMSLLADRETLYDVNVTIKNAVSFLRKKAAGRSIEIFTPEDDFSANVYGKPVDLFVFLACSIVDIIESAPSGSTVTIDASSDEKGDNTIVILSGSSASSNCTDNLQPAVFDRLVFQQVSGEIFKRSGASVEMTRDGKKMTGVTITLPARAPAPPPAAKNRKSFIDSDFL